MNRILVYGLSPNKKGGIETFLLEMNSFMTDGTVFDYIIENSSTVHFDSICKNGGRCLFISPKKKLFKNYKDWKTLLKTEKNNYDTVYFNLYSLTRIFPITMSLKLGYRVIVHAHNNKLHNCNFILKMLHSINRHLQKRLDIIRFTNSDLSSKFFFMNKKSELIYNAVDTDRFKFNEEKRIKVRKILCVKNDEHVYGFSGRITYQKNPLFLIKIFQEIYILDAKAKFIICGDGDLKERVEKESAKRGLNTLFLGNVTNVEDYYSAMDCFILPSRFEGLGLVLIEAQVNGLPCFTSKDVVPSFVKQTDLLTFLSLKQNPLYWAKTIVNGINKANKRDKYFSHFKETNFNIENESIRLEKILNNK